MKVTVYKNEKNGSEVNRSLVRSVTVVGGGGGQDSICCGVCGSGIMTAARCCTVREVCYEQCDGTKFLMSSDKKKSAPLKRMVSIDFWPLEGDFRRLVWRRGEGPPTKRRSWAMMEERWKRTTHWEPTAWAKKRIQERLQSSKVQLDDRNEDAATKTPRVHQNC